MTPDFKLLIHSYFFSKRFLDGEISKLSLQLSLVLAGILITTPLAVGYPNMPLGKLPVSDIHYMSKNSAVEIVLQ